MPWYAYILHFLGGAFLVNAVPHFVQGVSGNPFPTPFSNPPGRGNSPPVINVLWGAANIVIGMILIHAAVGPEGRPFADLIVSAVGGLLMAIMLANTFGSRRAGGGGN